MENNNSVCFVGRIEKISPIEGADKIEQAIISGWECVVQRDKYNIGQLVCIATNDAIIPFEIASNMGIVSYLKHRKKTNQYTVKTTKLRGVYSQALILDVQAFLPEGTDMMRDLGIHKYEEPEEIIQTASGKRVRYHKNPNFHIYHKFPNAKNVPNIFNEDDDVIITRKIHGSNARYGIIKKNKLSIWDRIKTFFGDKYATYDFVYGSHNVEKGSDSGGYYSEDIYKRVGDIIGIKQRLWNYVHKIGDIQTGLTLYAEIYGRGIQKYYDYGHENLQIAFFDIKQGDKYLNDEEYQLYLTNLGLPNVPILYKGKYNIDVINGYMKDFISGTKTPHEGVVVKHISGDRNKIAKFISPAYLEFQSKKEDSTDFH